MTFDPPDMSWDSDYMTLIWCVCVCVCFSVWAACPRWLCHLHLCRLSPLSPGRDPGAGEHHIVQFSTFGTMGTLTDRIYFLLLQDTTPHHWREGNLASAARCEVCRRSCGSSDVLAGMRCEWCGITVRTNHSSSQGINQSDTSWSHNLTHNHKLTFRSIMNNQL